MVSTDPKRFYGFNDHYFMGVIHSNYLKGEFDNDPNIKDSGKLFSLNATMT